jgi:hypothetical protein
VKLSTDEKQLVVSALSHAIRICDDEHLVVAAQAYRNLRKKTENALRTEKAA